MGGRGNIGDGREDQEAHHGEADEEFGGEAQVVGGAVNEVALEGAPVEGQVEHGENDEQDGEDEVEAAPVLLVEAGQVPGDVTGDAAAGGDEQDDAADQ